MKTLKNMTDDERYAVAKNTHTPIEILAELVNDQVDYVRYAVAGNLRTTTEMLAELSKDENWNVRSIVARNPNTPIKVLAKLAHDGNNGVRSGVAHNANTPRGLLKKLTKDESIDVRFAVSRNMNFIKNQQSLINMSESDKGLKYDDNKLRWDLLPLEDIEEVVKVYTEGAKKYTPNSWQNLPDGYNRYKAAMFRHLVEFEKGNAVDEETGCLHLAQVAWNAIAMLHYYKESLKEKI